METIINFEQFGKIARFHLPEEHSEIDRNVFLNLYWLVHGEREDGNNDIETFTVTAEQWKSAIKTLRIQKMAIRIHGEEIRDNWLCPLPKNRRGSLPASGIVFRKVEQRTLPSITPDWHNIGNAQHETIQDEWTGFKSQLEPVETSD